MGSNLLLDTRKHQWFLTMWPVLFYFTPLVGHFFVVGLFFFPPVFLHFHPSRHWHPRTLSRLCDSVMELPHGLHWCIFSLIFIYGGVLFVFFWSAGRSVLLSLPPCPSLPGTVPVLHPWSDSCLSGCAPRAPALLCSISLALAVSSWAGETQQKGKQLFRKWEMGFPYFLRFFLSTCLFLSSVWFVHTRSMTEKRESGAFLLFCFVSVGFSLIYFLFKLRHLKSPLLSLFPMQR